MKTKSPMTRVAGLAAVAMSAMFFLQVGGGSAEAQGYRYMSCSELWYARNAIYAEKGYCFKTARARAVFGPACFPPFGQLSRWEQEEVEESSTKYLRAVPNPLMIRYVSIP